MKAKKKNIAIPTKEIKVVSKPIGEIANRTQKEN
jgi:hypothetical protein